VKQRQAASRAGVDQDDGEIHPDFGEKRYPALDYSYASAQPAVRMLSYRSYCIGKQEPHCAPLLSRFGNCAVWSVAFPSYISNTFADTSKAS